MRGALEGGWRPQAATTACQLKLSVEQADSEVLAQQVRLQECEDAEKTVRSMLLEAEAEEERLMSLQVDLENAEAGVRIQRKELQRLEHEKAAAVQRVHDLQALLADHRHDGLIDPNEDIDIEHLQKSEKVAAKRVEDIRCELAKTQASLQECSACTVLCYL